ncbi:aspartate:alanine exchanger family transporter [Streptomyces sp. NPDC101132]|uniref:aspartate:alanine exchanger family transporter n=1 Tax=Streptomyces sp. NPDC101132 TaxID=3366110 RepID=UPI00381D6C8C
MVDWLREHVFAPYPELLIFLTVAVGFLIGRVRYKTFAVGAVTGCLVAGLLIGSQVRVPIEGPIRSVFFLMFLFALGYDVGPKFFRSLRRDALPQVLLTLVVCVGGLLCCWLLAELLGYGPGLAAGLLGGALTQSSVIGVAADTLANLPGLTPAQAQDEAHLVAIAYAVTYPLGTVLPAILLPTLLPRLLRRDLAADCAVLAADLDEAADPDLDAGRGYYEHVLRAYDVDVDGFAGRSIGEFEEEQRELDRRIYITRVRRKGTIIDHDADTRLRLGDTVAVSAMRGDLVAFDARTHIGFESDDMELLGYRTATLHIVLTGHGLDGVTVRTLRHEPFMKGVFIVSQLRADSELPLGRDNALRRGDTLVLTGPEPLVESAAERLGKAVPTTAATDMVWIATGLFLGGCIGIPALHAAGAPVSLSTSTGALLAGLVFGYVRARRPTYGNLPSAAQWLLGTLGLCMFVTVVGLNAGPTFASGLSEAGWPLLLAGAVGATLPLFLGFLFGHYVQRMPLPILLGALSGAQTTTAAIGALSERARSQIPGLGCTVPYALGNVLLTLWGSAIVLLTG